MMSPNVKGPAAGDSAAGPVGLTLQHRIALDIDSLEIYALGAVAVFPAARARLRELGAPPAVMFIDELAAMLADAMIDEDATFADAYAAAGSTPEAMVLLTEALGAVEAMRRADGPAWGVYVVERLAEERAEAIAPLTLRWGAEAFVHRWTTPKRIRAEVDRVLALAAGEAVAA